ncbi:dihydrolipoyl dehydrogenase family protein [Rhodovulum adriaticum]|uniref:Pyruvate/2-oxoglutarate dehydrogenase complex dihydrolipoamide dehydrogenase (E3) component n=1 Tax=Rhodovulum adriaticum TaxID=35804 RepID=A0A4R2NHB1_RHOAD|nr:FAD-dependent oxidoreductase [Rhodovulum adriaticum]MBK1636794.1 dihydrolipoamide dehydrogenase [Rhodovulum adriaticum]TCP20690.1 pyruvate/2-oxoglutarate dehydrogenase complex dihydrolipoamide dehydrogenase (E3) component [Rhodovulum adriaticum]
MARIKTDLCIIGAGSGGLSLAAGAVQMGARVVLVEGHKMGGDCLNYGCVPSKALLSAAHVAQTIRAGGCGIAGAEPQVDYAAAMDHVRQAIATIEPHDSVERFEGLGVRVIRGWGRFTGPRALQVGDDVIRARRYVIATGSRPVVPPIPGLGDVPYLTNETLFDLRTRPDHLLVIGGGPIGLEMAQAHARLGAQVTVIEGAQALGREDAELRAVVLDRLRAEGVRIVEGAAVERVAGTGGAITVQTGQGAFTGTHLLVAVGRKPALDQLNLDAAGVEVKDGRLNLDRGLRTTNRRIYAIGDAAGGAQFTHLAGYQAGVVIRPILLGLPARARADHIPRVTYTDPELAQIGQTEEEARAAHGDRLTVARSEFAGNDRAIASGRTHGAIKVMVVKGRPVGVAIAGPDAGELMAPWALAVANGLKMGAVAATVLPYPTLGEVNKRAAGAYFSPKLFENPWVKRGVRLVQALVP